MTVRTSTQTPWRIRHDVAQALGLEDGRVRVITPYVGGGFGGKLVGPDAVEAARLARQVPGRPVQVAWSRREDFFLDTFRPAAVVRLRSGLDRRGYGHLLGLPGVRHQPRRGGVRLRLPGHPLPGHRRLLGHPRPAPAGHRRLARARGQHQHLRPGIAPGRHPPPGPGSTPLAFRLRHASDARLIRLLEAVARQFGWVAAPAPSGRGAGLACGAWRGTLVATMAQVAVDRATGAVRVERVVTAVDLGLVVNPDGARQQVEGAITMGLGYALAEEVRFQGGRVLDENFDTYRIPRFTDLPRIEVVLMDNPGLPAQGLGEPPIVTMGAVLANAIFDAVGARVCDLPMTPARVLAAMPT